MRRALYFILAAFIFLMTGCSSSGLPENTLPKYQSYKEIPGVTQKEITELENLLAAKPRLVYGICLSTEACVHEDGSVGGFASLLCGRLSELFGFEFEFYPCSWEEMNEKIMTHEIDLVGDFTATPERLQKFYMTDAIIQRTIKVFTDTNAESLSSTAKKRPIQCAFMAGSTTYSRVAGSWNLPFEPVFITDQSAVPGMLLSGEIDAFIEEGMLEAAYDEYDFIQTDDYYPLTYSPISLTTANPEIAPIINIMQKYLKNGGYYELAELYNQGYKDYLNHKLSKQLTEEEREYIQAHIDSGTAILAACEADNYPTSFYNAKEKEFQGMALDTLSRISELTGLTFQVGNEPDAAWQELIEGLENGKYSIVSELLRSSQREGRFVWSDQPYSTNNYAMLSKAEYPEVDINQILFSRVGLMENSAHTDIFLEWFPESASTTMYKSNREAFEALASGEIDLLMASENMLLNLTNYQERPGYKANIVFKYSSDSYFGFNKDEEILRSIVNKAMRHINTDEISARWQRRVFDYENKMLKDVIPYLIAFVLVLSAGLFVIFSLFIKNRKISRHLEKLVAERTRELAYQTSALTTIFESIPDLVFCKDLNLNFTRCNRSFEEHFGRSAEYLIGRDDESGLGLPAEMAEQFREADRQVIREGRVATVEEIIPSADGSAPFFETVKIPLIQDGTVIGIMGISRDITERKTAGETLKLTLDNLDTCIYINEIDTGEILFINERMKKEFGGEDYYGKVCWKVLQNDFTEQCEFCPIPKLLESGDEYYVWEEHNTVTGKYYKNTDSLIKWHNGSLVHMQHSVDITEEVKLQRELEHASKAKSDFLSRMSHEIRTPLNAIIGMIGIAVSAEDHARIIHCLDRANSASKHLLAIINDILDMSKIEADKFELDSREFNFEKMLMNVTNVTNFRAEEKKQNFLVYLDENVPAFIIGDDLRLSQVIANLLTNAVKFTPEGGTVKLSIDKIDDAGGQLTLRIAVEDDGIGISEEQQKRLFTSFEQADGGIARKFGGTGLGLAISKRIVELMGGRIWIESELGKGSKFIFTTKAVKGKNKPHRQLSHKINKDDVRILAVDDSLEIREYLTYVLTSLGLPNSVAAGGHEALDMVKNSGDKPYNIFFIDWQMPEMDGIELTRRIKEDAPDNSVVFMISVAEWNLIEKDALVAGVRSFISKPLFPSTLVNAINECVEIEPKKVSPRDGELSNMGEGMSFSGHTILIAEDIEVNREIMSAVLEDSGVSIDYAENGLKAVSLFQENPDKYSLILMDIHMPEMDGYEATRRIRALSLPHANDIPIVAMTANVFREDIENCLSAGMNNHIGKPVDTDDLFEKLRLYLS